MITGQAIVSAVAEILGGMYPGFTVYTQFTATKFERPAIYIEMGERKLEDIGCGCIDVTAEIKIAVILAATSQGHADKELLASCASLIIAPLWRTAIALEEATLLVLDATAGELGDDYAPVTITANYQDNVPTVEDVYPIMENLLLTEETL